MESPVLDVGSPKVPLSHTYALLMRLVRVLSMVSLVLLAACAPGDVAASTTTEPPPVTTTTITTLAPKPTCDREGAPREEGVVASFDSPMSDSTAIGLISWKEHRECELFVVSFESSGGAPATTPPSAHVEYLEYAHVLRVSVGSRSSAISDQLVETGLVQRLFVVNAVDGGQFIDLHLRAPARASATVDSSPATLTIELQPGIIQRPDYSVSTDRLVLLSPHQDIPGPSPVQVAGYARGKEEGVLVIATLGSTVLFETTLELRGGATSWAEFETTMSLEPGQVRLFVGEDLPESVGLEGIGLRLTVE